MTAGTGHPLAEVTRGLPEWAKWMLYGIVVGQPLDADRVHRHIDEADRAPELPTVPELEADSVVRLEKLRLGPGCYGLAEETTIEFGPRLTLIYGENGTGKSSLVRILRAFAGRPSAQRPPHNTFTRQPAEATVSVSHDGVPSEHRWRADAERPRFHIEVFDSADTWVEGIEYQVRPRSVLALEELRSAVDELTITVENLDVPVELRAALTEEDLRLLNEPSTAVGTLDEWMAHTPERAAAEVERALADLGDEALAQRHADIEREGRLAGADVTLVDVLERLDLAGLGARLAAESDLGTAPAPPGVDPTRWIAFVRQALPLFESSARRCVLCDSEIAERHAGLVAAYRALLADERAAAMQAADHAAQAIQDAVAAHHGATEGAAPAARELAASLVNALQMRDSERIAADSGRIHALEAETRARLAQARADWHASRELLAAAEGRRTVLRHELTAARRSAALSSEPRATDELARQLRRRERRTAAARLQGTKTRISHALRRHTEELLDSPYGEALKGRLAKFKVPHADRLTSRHAARAGRALRHHAIGKTSTDQLFSEGERRALALADFAAELDTRPAARHPIVIDDPVSSLDYRRLEHVVEYIQDLLEQKRQVVVLTHSVWLAAELLKKLDQRKDGSGRDRAWTLVRTGSRIGETTRLSKSALGNVDQLAARVESLIASAERENDPIEQQEIIRHGLGVLRAWCESFVEQKVLCGTVARLDWRVNLAKLVDVNQRKLDQGNAVARVHHRLHQRIDAHHQPDELMHRPDGLADFKELWAETQQACSAMDDAAEKGSSGGSPGHTE